MSLLLDARKKSQQENSIQSDGRTRTELSLEEYASPEAKPPTPAVPVEYVRNAGQNLFNAKLPGSSTPVMGTNKSLLIGLAAVVILLVIGAGYFWYADSENPAPSLRLQPPQSLSAPVTAPIQQTTVIAENDLKNIPGSGEITITTPTKIITRRTQNARLKSATAPTLRAPSQASISNNPIQINQQQADAIDPVLSRAYLAYQNGKLDEAQQLYLDALSKDKRNVDALSGLAVIAQQAGDNETAAGYFSRVLALDPRNAVANAGMSALVDDDNSESRLKTLLHEQKDSAALHFALGNLYADQSRWDEAQQAYFNAYALDPKNPALAFNLAVSLEHLGQNKPAAEYYRHALQLDQPPNTSFDHRQIEQRVQQLSR